MRRLVIVVLALCWLAAPAWAHVKVSPQEAPRGGYATLVFAVPNEEAPAKTVKVEIFFPDDAKFTTVTPGDTAGWTAQRSATAVTFSGGELAGEDEGAFAITLGPLPAAGDAIVFKVLQTYDNGTVARWIDVQIGTEEPPHPAPVVKLTGVAPATTSTAVAPTAPSTTTELADGGDDDGGSAAPLILLAALFVAAIGAGIAIGVRRRGSA